MILQFFWGFYLRQIINYYMIPYMILFCLFCLDSTLFHYKKLYKDDWNRWYICSFIAQVINLILVLYFIGFEILQMIFFKRAYFTFSIWNSAKILVFLFTLGTIICSFAEIPESQYVPLSAVNMAVLWTLCLYFC